MNVRGENFIMKVGIDLGGSHIAIGVVDENGRIIEKQERRILDKEKQEIKTFIEEYIIKNIKEMSKKYKITNIGIAIPGTVNQLEIATFSGMKKLKSVVIPEQTASVPAYTFAKCSALSKVAFSKNMNEIDSTAFVKSNQVNDPVDVRYLWVNSGYMNFFNKEGFPALPFRTDKYRLETEGVCVNPEPMIPQLDLFLFIGQSNMAGRGYITDNYKGSIKDVYLLTLNGDMEPARNPLNKYSTIRKQIDLQGVGPAYSFAKAIADKTKHKLGLVVNARGGSSINSWLKGAKDDYYGEALSRIRQAMKYGTLKAIIWHQGEADSRNPEAYMAKLQKLVADLREDLGDTKLPVIVGEIAEWRVNGTSDAFNKMLRTVPRHIPYSYCVSSRELVPLINENDPHFSADSQIILGRRYAEAAYKACYFKE